MPIINVVIFLNQESYEGNPAAELYTLLDDKNKAECHSAEGCQPESVEPCRKEVPVSNGTSSPASSGQRGSKRALDEVPSRSVKRICPTVIIDSDDDSVEDENKSVSSKSDGAKFDNNSVVPGKDGDFIDLDPPCKDKFYCTSCGKADIQVYAHPLLKAAVCEICKRILEIKCRKKVLRSVTHI